MEAFLLVMLLAIVIGTCILFAQSLDRLHARLNDLTEIIKTQQTKTSVPVAKRSTQSRSLPKRSAWVAPVAQSKPLGYLVTNNSHIAVHVEGVKVSENHTRVVPVVGDHRPSMRIGNHVVGDCHHMRLYP